VTRVVLHDEHGLLGVGHVVVASLADGDPLEQVLAPEQGLAQLPDVPLSVEGDVQQLPHGAVPAVAAHQVLRPDFQERPIRGPPDPGRHPVGVLLEGHQLVAVPHADRGQGFRLRLEERLQGVLGDELVGLQGEGSVVAGTDLGFRLRHGGVGQPQDRGVYQGGDDEHVHGVVPGESCATDLFRQAHAAVDLHGAGVATLHLGQELRRVLPLDQHAAHAPLAQIYCQGEAHRARPHHEDLGVQCRLRHALWVRYYGPQGTGETQQPRSGMLNPGGAAPLTGAGGGSPATSTRRGSRWRAPRLPAPGGRRDPNGKPQPGWARRCTGW
jgi:hypothetical protein